MNRPHGENAHVHMVGVSSRLSHAKDADMLDVDADLRGMSDDDDSLGEEESFVAANLIHGGGIEDEIAESLNASGTMPGLAAAAAVVTSRRRQRPHKFETNPSTRKRQYTRLLRKLKHTMQEFCTRCGQQAALLCVSPGKDNPSVKVFGASPLDQVIRSCQNLIIRDLEKQLQEKAPTCSSRVTTNLFELPSLIIDGIPTTLEKMNQAQLRMFIPEMLKYSTGRGKPGWGRDSTRPVWWPADVPWANVRRDVRTDDQKLRVPWTRALRQIVFNCYKHHGREDLLNCFPSEVQENHSQNERSQGDYCAVTPAQRPTTSSEVDVTPPTLVQTVQNSDGSVSLIQIDSGQTIATITQDQTGQAVATLTNDGIDGTPLAVTMQQVNNQQWAISTTDTHGLTSIPATVVESGSSEGAVLAAVGHNQPPVVLASSGEALGILQQKAKTSQDHLSDNPHTIGFTLSNEVCQSVAALQGSNLPSGSRIILSATSDGLDEHASAAMVHIPVSVYEKIASSIQDPNLAGVVRRSPDSQLGPHDGLELDTGQDSPGDVNLDSLRVEA